MLKQFGKKNAFYGIYSHFHVLIMDDSGINDVINVLWPEERSDILKYLIYNTFFIRIFLLNIICIKYFDNNLRKNAFKITETI